APEQKLVQGNLRLLGFHRVRIRCRLCVIPIYLPGREAKETPNMARFMYIFRGGGVVTPGLTPTEMQQHLDRWRAWAAALSKAGHHRGGQPVETRGKTIRGKGRIVADGPFAESKDMVTGSMLLEAASLEEATELARDCPVFLYDGSVEIRPVLELET